MQKKLGEFIKNVRLKNEFVELACAQVLFTPLAKPSETPCSSQFFAILPLFF